MRWGGTGIGTVDGARLTFRYDAAGRLVEVIDANQGSTRYEVNPRGLLSSRTDAAGRVVQFGYDEAYRLASLTDENRETYRFQYDRRDLVPRRLVSMDTSVRTSTTFAGKARSCATGRSRRDTNAM
ncbi:hypothetical protein [Burkholderia sp.]|uniref:hypothetical protein n=1 Tax=Burkholderia sp. TaxID=36773 RepID=UPI00258E9A46|nr:hypothetical protein [Burkholderia sp.]MCL4636666.1 hypothetical protein [Burkholderia sp.]